MLRLLVVVVVEVSTFHVNYFRENAIFRVVGNNLLNVSESVAY